MINRQQATQILDRLVSNERLRHHCVSVGIVMEHIAAAAGENSDLFYITGLLHDADWEACPEQHPQYIVDHLRRLGEAEMAHAISAHYTQWNVPYSSLLDKALVATDELTGLVCATARVTNGLGALTAESVVKRFNNPKFAAGVDRAEVSRALAILGVELRPLADFIIAALQPSAEQIGLPPTIGEFRLPVFPQRSPSSGPAKPLAGRVKKLSDEEIVRRQKRAALMAEGIDPYPGDSFTVDTWAKMFHLGERAEGDTVVMAGRLMVIRDQGRAAFCELLDSTGRVQLYLSQDTMNASSTTNEYVELFKKRLDRGDIIGIEGKLFITKTKVLTVHVTQLRLLCKSLKPLPAVKQDERDGKRYDAFTDPELRYRQRYVDLILNPQIREIFLKRTCIVDTIRHAFNRRGYFEAQTPILQPLYGGASARPFVTYHNALDMPLYLRIANELYLKRLIVGGFDGVYEFSTDFRNEGMDRFHNPEFTQVELYVAYQDFQWMMSLVEETVEAVCLALHGTTEIQSFGHRVNFKRPWRRVTMREAILSKTEIDISLLNEEDLRRAIVEAQISGVDTAAVGKGKLVDELFSATVEKELIQPTFITEYPVELSPLAKKSPGKPGLVDRFEGFACGKEFCNAFSELNDPIDQFERFEAQLELSKRGDSEAMNAIDLDFLRALEYGMPPTAGLGLGIDRLTMVMTNQTSIQEVILFPHMRPEK